MSSRGIGLILVAVGLAGFASLFGGLPALPATVWVLMMIGIVFGLWVRPLDRFSRRQRMAATVLLGVAALAGAGPIAGAAPAGIAGAAFLGVWQREGKAWALLTGGLLETSVLTNMASALAPVWNPAPIFFLGSAATFSLLYLLPDARGGGRRWALAPALFFAVMTVVVNDPLRGLPGWLIPTLLIAGGATMLFGLRRR